MDEYMIYEARLLGASAVLLICSILTESQLRDDLAVCETLGLSALVEAHDEGEVQMALKAGGAGDRCEQPQPERLYGGRGEQPRLREQIPPEVVFVSESGVKDAGDVQRLREIGADAVLIGETLMRAPDKRARLKELRGEQ